MEKLLYKEESYKIIGLCFEIFNTLGPGLKEKNYQKALEELLSANKISFAAQLYVPIKINGKVVGKYFLDFIVKNKIAIELKAGDHFHRRDIEQLHNYLKSTGLKLGLLINFTSDEVKFKRILNVRNYS